MADKDIDQDKEYLKNILGEELDIPSVMDIESSGSKKCPDCEIPMPYGSSECPICSSKK